MIAGPASPDSLAGKPAAAPWRLLALVAGCVALAAVLTMSLGDTLVALGRPGLAASLPGNTALAAGELLPPQATRPTRGDLLDLARRALHNAPLSAPALSYLAAAASREGDTGRARDLLKVAAGSGWRDETTQRRAYNQALEDDDSDRAMMHADALLRQGLARDELYPQFDRGSRIPAFRQALVKVVGGPARWPRDYLASRGALLDDGPLAEMLAARAKRTGSIERAIAAPVIGVLLRQGRDAMAARVWRGVAYADGLAPGTLAWRDGALIDHRLAFDWRMPEGYRADADGDGSLSAAPDASAEPAMRQLALPAGRYRIAAADPGSTAGIWLWSVSCGARPSGDLAPLTRGSAFTVPAGCPVQTLGFARLPGQDDARIGPLVIGMAE